MIGKIGTLYLVATPIGNLEDITYRAVRVLSEVDLIACEDTRHSIKLLNHLGIKKPLISFHEHSRAQRAEELLEKLRAGQSIALVSDAGMPVISDPGEDLVSLCIKAEVPVTVIPGCTASLTGLILSGLPARRFAFEGFLPQQQGERRKALEALKNEDRTMIFYEGPHRIKKMLGDALAILGDRPCSLARELTKLHEEVLRGTISELLRHFESNEPKGEFVVVMGGNPMALQNERKDYEGLSIPDHVQSYMDEGLDRMEAMKRAAKDRGLSKREIYQALNSHK
jgi:16S rRNA (cytidine1402-2'-O)-methyltransferase